MEFGRNISAPLENIDFSLPADHQITSEVLRAKGDKSRFDLRIGSSLWNCKEWAGTLFPQNTHEKDRLREYAKAVNYVELNSTFYAMPKRETIISWFEKTKEEDFLFAPKMVLYVTHLLRFRNSMQLIDEFLDIVSEFRENLGPVFFQCPDNFGTKYIGLLAEAIAELASFDLTNKRGVFFELRHPAWFSDSQSFSAVARTLADHDMGLVLTDTPGRRDVLHMALTSPRVFIRFNGNGEHPVDQKRLTDWAERIAFWKAQGLTNVYFTIHQTDPATFPASLVNARNIFAEKGLY